MLLRRPRQTSTTPPKPKTGNIFLDSPTTTTAPRLPAPSPAPTVPAAPAAPAAPKSNIFLDAKARTPAPSTVRTVQINDGKVTDSYHPPKPPKKRDDPIRRLGIDIAKIKATMPMMNPGQQAQAQQLINQVSQGNPRSTEDAKKAQQQAAFGGPMFQATVQSFGQENKTDPGAIAPGLMGPVTATGEVIRQVSRPFQAVNSAIAEASREGETNKPFNLGPIHLRFRMDPGKVLEAGREGFDLHRHDTPSSILQETAQIRHDQGRSFGPLLEGYEREVQRFPGGKVIVPLVTDLAVGAVTDPLTYATFGASSAVRAGLAVVADVTSAERAAQVAREGIDILTPAERATVEARVGEEGMAALEKGARGGLGVRVPFGDETGRTILTTGPIRDAARAAGDVADKIPGLNKVIERVGDAGQYAKRIVIPRAKLIDEMGEDIGRRYYDLEARSRGYVHSNVDRSVKRITTVMRRNKVTPTELRTVIGPALDIGGTGLVAEPRLQKVVDAFKGVRQTITDDLISAGRLNDAQGVAELGADWVDKATAAANKLGDDAINTAMARLSNGGGDIDKVMADLQAARARGEKLIADAHARAQGVVATENYMPHVRTPEGDNLWSEQALGNGRVGSILSGDPYLQGRELRDMSAAQINAELSRELGRPIEYFTEDPLLAFATRARAAYGGIAGGELTQGLVALRSPEGRRLAIPWADLPDAPTSGPVLGVLGAGEKILPAGYAEVKLYDPVSREFSQLAVPTPVAELVQKTWKVLHDPTELQGLWDQMLQWWKTMATVPLPFGVGFHLRNAESNVMLNWMSGVGVGMADYYKARLLQKAMNMGLKETGDWQQYLTEADRALVNRALEREVLSTGVLGALDDLPNDPNLMAGYHPSTMELKQKVGHYLQKANPVSTKGVMAQAGRTLGQGVEENARLAHFIAAERAFGDTDAAARSVRRWLFDYHDVTASEQQIKRLIPFYTWARKSLSAVVETILRDPRKLAQFERARQSISDSAGVDLSNTLVPGYVSDNPTATPIGVAGRGLIGRTIGASQAPGTPLIAAPDTPLNTPADIVNAGYGLVSHIPGLNRVLPQLPGSTPQDAIRTGVGMVGGPAGIAKAMLEDLANVNFFSGAPIRDEYVPTPTPLNLIPGMGNITASTRNYLNALWPTLTKTEGLFPNDPADKDKQARRWLSTFTGLPVYPIGLTTQQAEAYRRLEPVAKFIANMQAAGVMG